jgi:poly(3-hydroxybutyrate) depolymerase
MKYSYLLSLLLLAGSLSTQAQNTVTVDGTKRSYIVYAPKNLGENRPLLISCHGMNQDANYQKGMLKIETVADTAKFLTVFPEGIDKSWDISGNRDIKFMTALIDAMVAKYNIDRNRVYLSGFSMGGMFTYHAMNKMPDQIAAFAPISGYPMGGTTANASVRPIPIIHTHGTTDDVVNFSGVQGALNAWIKHNGCSTTPTVTTRYRGASHITRRVWGGGNDGVEVVLMEMANKGHWISNDNGVLTGDEIWRFCKRYSLNKTSPTVRMTSPTAGITHLCFAPQGEAFFPDFTLSATASDSNGSVVSIDFYDGNTLIGSVDKAPYTVTLTSPKAGRHTLKAVATDNDGETGTATVDIVLTAPQAQMSLSQQFNEGNSLPAGWTTYDSNEQRAGYSNGYSQGCRILQMTGSKHDFNYGLYFRNINGKQHAGYAKFAAKGSSTQLTLTPGRYALRYKLCNWNRPQFAPVDICIEKTANGEAVASDSYTPTVNIGNSASNSFSGVQLQNLEFNITETDNYTLAFYSDASEWSDAVIGYLVIAPIAYTSTGIDDVLTAAPAAQDLKVYDLQGRFVGKRGSLKPGLYIQQGKTIMIR